MIPLSEPMLSYTPVDETSDPLDFNVFRLDLKPRTHSSPPATLVTQLEKSSIAKLIGDRIGTALNHMDKLHARVEDTSSKVLVTGDLNAGKSTFVNTILGRPVMPMDQQPCTTALCKVHDAAEMGGAEEVHVVKEGVTYDLSDESTFTRATLSDLDQIVSENENGQQIIKVYLSNPHSPAPSFIHNSVVDISLINAPGLNRDSVKTSHPEPVKEDMQGEDVYVEHRDKVLSAIGSTKSLLSDLQSFNNEHWVVRYPVLKDQPQTSEVRRPTSRRSLSIADDSSFQADVVVSPVRGGLVRSITLPDVSEKEEDTPADKNPEPSSPTSDPLDFNVFRLDLKLGTHSSSPATLVTQLEKSSIAKLIDDRIGTALSHMDKLHARVEDTSSKVLVTGDLNAGKSTFVNAILGRPVMPVDQQPCTTALCEVHDAAEIGGVEEVHVVKEGVTYDLSDESTFTRATLSDLDQIVSENENGQQIIKVYLSDPRSPAPSFLHNGVVDISLIDAPGLNRDSVKTTAVFARQEEIDVVVFVVSAENHFTLSAQEFLKTASNEKAYLFIVVNKFEGIRDKKKCRRLILEQVKALSPRTYEDAEDLVHFVDSASTSSPPSEDESFKNLESALRTFVLTKRVKSKLQPASTYLTRLLSDVNLLVSANAIVAQSEATKAEEDLKKSRPLLEKITKGREAADEALEVVEEEGTRTAIANAKTKLTEALENVACGTPSVKLPTYPGLLGIWEWTGEVRRAMLSSLDLAVKLTEDAARITTSGGVHRIEQIGEEHLPEDVAKSKRVFIPEAMFSARSSKSARRRSSNNVITGVGIGLSQRPDLLNTTFLDIYDFHHQFAVVFADEKDLDAVSSPTALGVASVGLGALTMIGGQALGVRGLIEGVVRVTDLLGNENTRKWVAPIVGAVAIGMTWYVILELPSTVPRTIGRRIKKSLKDAAASGLSEDWVEANSERVGRETRKVLRLASWDLKQRITTAIDERSKEVKAAEEVEKKSKTAVDWFGQARERTGHVLEQVQDVLATRVP